MFGKVHMAQTGWQEKISSEMAGRVRDYLSNIELEQECFFLFMRSFEKIKYRMYPMVQSRFLMPRSGGNKHL
jgi:hypothetical protein